jgi:hypothetical protein
MKHTPAGAPDFQPHRAAYKELLTTLQYAYYLFHTKGDGGNGGHSLHAGPLLVLSRCATRKRN